VEKIVEIELSEKEKKEFAASVEHVKELVAAMDQVLAK
jgi:malate/lactate dehydrogenase